MVLCGVLYVVALALEPGAVTNPRGLTGFLSPGMRALARLGMTGASALWQGHWWTLLTALYLHGGLIHFLFNMLWLRQLGTTVEALFGSARFFLIFTVSGAIGMLASSLVGVAFTIGASGAILGLMGALVAYGRSRGDLLGAVMYRQLLLWALVILLMGLLMPGVNNVAHVSGFGTGYLLATLMRMHGERRTSRVVRFLALGCSILTALCFFLAFSA